MEQGLLLNLRKLVADGFFNKSVEDFGPAITNLELLIPGRVYFIKVRQMGKKPMDTIVMYKETIDNYMSFRQYYFRKNRLFEYYEPLEETDIDIKIPIEPPDYYILDITDIIINESRKRNKRMTAFLSDETMAGPNLIAHLPYSLGPGQKGTNQPGMIASYLGAKDRGGGKMRMKTRSKKSTRRKRTRRRRRNNKTRR